MVHEMASSKFVAIISVLVAVTQGSIKWGYGDINGPDKWPELFPHQCAGTFQSPVDIRPLETIYNRYLTKFNIYEPPQNHARYVVHNNGKSIQVDTQGLFLLDNGGLRYTYKVEQFHFHWGDSADQGAEHTIYDTADAMEMHIVSWNIEKYRSYEHASQSRDGLVVLGILFNVSHFDNPVMEGIVQVIPRIRDPDWKIRVNIRYIPLVQFLPNSPEKYFRYQGSLTTPMCYESVTWTVYKERQYISERQLNYFRRALTPSYMNEDITGLHKTQSGHHTVRNDGRERLVNNFRPSLPLNRRVIERSFI